MLKRVIICLLLMIFLIPTTSAIELNAQAAVTIDSVTGRILFEKNAHMRLGMASTTKIMTGILAIEKGNMQDVVTISKKASNVEGSSIYLKENEKVTFETLVYGLMLKSGNDSAIAIAEHISGSEAEFVKLMNAKAKELGLKDTSFANPHGLYCENHYTTAFELAQIGRYAMSNPLFAKIANTSKYVETPPEQREKREIYNANKLMSMFPEADGIKPGYTPETGRTLIGSATKNGWRIITVTLNCSDDWREHKQMFDYAFSNYTLQKIAKKGQSIGTYRVTGGVFNEVGIVLCEDVYAPIKNGESAKGKIDAKQMNLKAPVMCEQSVGEAIVNLENGYQTKAKLQTNSAVQAKSKSLFENILGLILALFGVTNNG